MHRKLRSQGRVPGAEGRAVIEENRKRRAKEKRQDKITALSSVTTDEKGFRRHAEKILRKRQVCSVTISKLFSRFGLFADAIQLFRSLEPAPGNSGCIKGPVLR
jgi:hypothetical protein